MKCKQCKYVKVCMAQADMLGQVFDVNYDGEHGCTDFNPFTNADRIRDMSDEELADFICRTAYSRETPWSEPFLKRFCDNCPTVRGTYESGKEDDFHECDFVDGECPHGSNIVWWLKQPAEEVDDG